MKTLPLSLVSLPPVTVRPRLDIGSAVTYGVSQMGQPQGCRVNAFYKEAPRPDFNDSEEPEFVRQMFEEMYEKSAAKREAEGLVRLMPCAPEEGTYVGLVAVCGTIVPITAVTHEGDVKWDAATLKQHREQYRKSLNHPHRQFDFVDVRRPAP